jgi:Cu/Ag efflux pump CusA
VPYGVCGSLLALVIMGTPFGFMAFLGIVSLIGVIVSHIVVLFNFIEEMHAKGEPLKQSLKDAGLERLRPMLITVGRSCSCSFLYDGRPLWKPLCYAQIGGLVVATFITLLLVPRSLQYRGPGFEGSEVGRSTFETHHEATCQTEQTVLLRSNNVHGGRINAGFTQNRRVTH